MNVFIVLPNQLFISKDRADILKMYDSIYIYEQEDPSIANPGINKRLVMRYCTWLKSLNPNTRVINPQKMTSKDYLEHLVGIKKQVNLFKPTNYYLYRDKLMAYTFHGISANILTNTNYELDSIFLINNSSVWKKCKDASELSFDSFHNVFVRKVKSLDTNNVLLKASRDIYDQFTPQFILDNISTPMQDLVIPNSAKDDGFTLFIDKLVEKHISSNIINKGKNDIFSNNIITLLNHGLITMKDYILKISEMYSLAKKLPRGVSKRIRTELIHLCIYNYLYVIYNMACNDEYNNGKIGDVKDVLIPCIDKDAKNYSPHAVINFLKTKPKADEFMKFVSGTKWMTNWMAYSLWKFHRG